MLEDFLNYIDREKLFTRDDRLILAVSGGVDSMVMLRLFGEAGFDCAVAHCNFRLRGGESDEEEAFLRDHCAEQGIELYVKAFDTKEHASVAGISVEMAARELRYAWFRKLLDELSFSYIATAHHQDDLAETLLLNLCRGTGIRGLTGIPPKNGKIVRPMLFTRRDQVLEYAGALHVPYRNDSSNSELLYQRNQIRHQVIPLLREINPSFTANAAQTARILRDTEKLFRQKIAEIREEVAVQAGNSVRFDIRSLKAVDAPDTVLFELLHPFGFNAGQVRSVLQTFEAEAGKTFFSSRYRLVKDREKLIVTPLENVNAARYYLEEGCTAIREPLMLTLELIVPGDGFRFSRDQSIADLDYDRLHFPLLLKKWEPGEYFRPLGMPGFKKLSDFFIDEKLSIPEKEALWILYSERKVVWVVGRRIDDRFKITNETKKVLRINAEPGTVRIKERRNKA